MKQNETKTWDLRDEGYNNRLKLKSFVGVHGIHIDIELGSELGLNFNIPYSMAMGEQ